MGKRLFTISLVLFIPGMAWGVTLPDPPVVPDISCGTSSGTTIAATTGAEFTAALASAAALDEANGTTITLLNGASFTGTGGKFILPVKAGTGCITIQPSNMAVIPAAGTRIDPSYSSVLPKIVANTNNVSPIQTAAGAHHYKFIGVEVVPAAEGTLMTTALVAIGDGSLAQDTLAEVPHHIELDRVYVHAYSDTSTLRRGIGINSASTTIKNSYIANVKEVGNDSQAIQGANGPGPYVISNNFLEAACENVMIGGSAINITDQNPSDIKILNNTFSKRLSWKVGDPTYGGIHWSVKNLLEFKAGVRVLVDGNTFDYSWTDAQVGYAILVTPRNNDNGLAPWAATTDIDITNNRFRHTSRGFQIQARDNSHGGADVGYVSATTKRVRIANNLFLDLGYGSTPGAGGGMFVLYANTASTPPAAAEDLTVEHNTVVNNGIVFNIGDTVNDKSPGLTWRNNIHFHNTYGVVGTSAASGTATLDRYFTGYVYTHNVMITNPIPNSYPANDPVTSPTKFNASDAAAVGWTNTSIEDYSLTGGSAYHNAATDGTDIGVDMVALNAALLNSGGGTPPAPGPPAKVTGGRTLAAHPTLAHGATFLWTPNSESDLAGYRIYPRISTGVYGPYVKQVTPATAYADKIPLTQFNYRFGVAGTYCFAVAAYNQAGVEGEKSDEVCVTGIGMTDRTAVTTRSARQ